MFPTIIPIIKDETINTDVSDSSKLPSLNNQSKSNKESTINHESKISSSKSQEGNSSYLQLNKSTDNDNTELPTEFKLSTNEEDVTKKSNIEKPNQSKRVSIIKDKSIHTDVSDSSKLPSLNNQSKSNKESTINSNLSCLEGNSSYLQLNKSTDNENTELPTE